MTDLHQAVLAARIPALLLAATALAAPATAQSLRPVMIDASATLTSDYRFRGVSLSDRKPALQGSITLSTLPGFFASAWGSTVNDHNGADAEIDLMAGWSGPVGLFDLSAGAIHYAYVGGDGSATELFGSIALPFGPLRGTLGINFAPSQGNIGGDNRYIYGSLSAAVPGTPLTLKASAGHEHGALVTGDSYGRIGKWDWRLGAEYGWQQLIFSLAYVGNDLPTGPAWSARGKRKADDRAVVAVTYSF